MEDVTLSVRPKETWLRSWFEWEDRYCMRHLSSLFSRNFGLFFFIFTSMIKSEGDEMSGKMKEGVDAIEEEQEEDEKVHQVMDMTRVSLPPKRRVKFNYTFTWLTIRSEEKKKEGPDSRFWTTPETESMSVTRGDRVKKEDNTESGRRWRCLFCHRTFPLGSSF